MSVFKDKILLITGGTGSFGNAVLRRFLDSDIKEIRIFSRDEKKTGRYAARFAES
jgi:UDP-glucose 4-epimerase